MQPLLNHMVISHLMDFLKDTTTKWIAPGLSRDPMEKSLKSHLHLLMYSLTWNILLACKRPHGKITEIRFVAFCIETNTIYFVCNKCSSIVLHIISQPHYYKQTNKQTVSLIVLYRISCWIIFQMGFPHNL